MSIIGQRYHQDKLAGDYDVIIIGSGIGGLAAGSLLAKAGKKVLILERHYTAGGFTHTYQRKGYEWDVGVHYIGEVNRENSPVRRIFDYLTDNQLQWEEMGPVYDRMICGDNQFDFRAGHRKLKADLIARFPKQEKGILAYFDMIKQVRKGTPMAVARRMMPPWFAAMLSPLTLFASPMHSDKTTAEVLERLIDDPELRGILATQWGDCGLTPQQSSFTIHAMIAGHYMGGAAYPVGGSSQFAATIEPIIRRAGGQILVRAEVDQILTRHGRAHGVRMASGEEIHAPKIISTVGVPNTYRHLLDQHHRERYGIPDNLSKVKAQGGHLCLYVGLKQSAADLGLDKTNLWVFPSLDHDANLDRFRQDPDAPFPLTYISFPSAKDPRWSERFPDKATIEVVTMAPYQWFERWQDQPWLRRGEEYEALKERFAQRMLAELYRQVPAIEGKIDYHELSTPLSTRHFCNYDQGEIYGLDHDPVRFAQKWLRPKSPIKNLYLGGQDVFVAGVVGAMTGGLMAGAAVLGPAVLKMLPKASGIPIISRLFARA